MKSGLKGQLIPLVLTVVLFLFLVFFLKMVIVLLNLLPTHTKLSLQLRHTDIFIGFSIYLKTAIDFAIFIGNLMKSNPGWKKRIAIETGTALGNACGTVSTLIVWVIFKELPLLLALMVLLSSFVLLNMAEEGLEEYLKTKEKNYFLSFISWIRDGIVFINSLTKPFISKFIPEKILSHTSFFSFKKLSFFSFMVPFVLGLDDFAGYIPLFSIINVFGFAIGVFLGHMLLNIGLFLSPSITVSIVRNSIVILGGSILFIGISLIGFYEALVLLFTR